MGDVAKNRYKYRNFSGGRKPGGPGGHRKFFIEPNLRGFLCSCNNREKECVREAYNLLNKFADKLTETGNGGTKDSEKVEETASGAGAEEEEDISQSLSAEISDLKRENSDSNTRRFQVIESGAKNLLFIRTTLTDPTALALSIVEDINTRRVQQTRFLLRLVPIEVTCKATVEDIVRAFAPLAERHFKEAPRVFSIAYNHRNNSGLSKEAVIKAVADRVAEVRPDHKVDLKGAEVTVVVEVIRGFAFLGVAPKYLEHKRYNLLAAFENEAAARAGSQQPQQQEEEKVGAGDEEAQSQ